jgi:sugar phosphate isomerase/epimerase
VAGLQQVTHNEAFEAALIDGKRVYDMLFERLDAKLVKCQFQMSSINQGMVAADYFRKYPGRFISMHIQDVDMNAPLPAPAEGGRGRGRGRPQVPVGKGTIDWVDTFAAARVGGIKNYFVEQTLELTRQSVAALKAMPS